jgi:hypothetical protein
MKETIDTTLSEMSKEYHEHGLRKVLRNKRIERAALAETLKANRGLTNIMKMKYQEDQNYLMEQRLKVLDNEIEMLVQTIETLKERDLYPDLKPV